MKSLTAGNSLEWLSLASTRLDVEDCQVLSKLMSSSVSLKELDISRNALPPQAIELIIGGLYRNTTLKVLNMRGSYFSLQNTVSLASVLRTKHTLVFLSLIHCGINSAGACQLASALSTNDTLQVLHLSHNPIGVKGATAFAEMLLVNKSLKELNLQDHSIGEEGTQKMIDSLKYNTTVKNLYLPLEYKLSFARAHERVNFDIPQLPPSQRIHHVRKRLLAVNTIMATPE